MWTRFPYPFIGFYFSIFSIPQLFLGVEKIPISSLYWLLLFSFQYPPAICGCGQDSHISLLGFTFLSLVSPSYFWVWTRFPYHPFIGFYFSIFSIPQLFLGVDKIPISLYWVLLFYVQYPPAISCFDKC